MTQFAAATTFRVDPLAGVRTRRILALAIDLVLVSVLASVLWLACWFRDARPVAVSCCRRCFRWSPFSTMA